VGGSVSGGSVTMHEKLFGGEPLHVRFWTPPDLYAPSNIAYSSK
jgi:hypothetical protein